MNPKSVLTDGMPGEPYLQGVRRRIRSAMVIWALALASLAVGYGVFWFTESTWLTVGTALLFGVACSSADLMFDPVGDDQTRAWEKTVWLFLFVPVIFGLAAVSVYSSWNAQTGFKVFQAGLAAWLLGNVLGYTKRIVLRFQKIGPNA